MSYSIMSNTPFAQMSDEIYDQLYPGLSWMVERLNGADNALDKAFQRINALEDQVAALTQRLEAAQADVMRYRAALEAIRDYDPANDLDPFAPNEQPPDALDEIPF